MLITKFRKNIHLVPLLVFHIVLSVIVFTNFPWGKFFMGWDALSPELNLPVNFGRIFNAFWQENQGLGLLGGHGFAALLPQHIIVWLLSLIVPTEAIRPIVTFICLYVGGLGMYFLSYRILKELIEKFTIKLSQLTTQCSSLITALFYMLNLGTLQMFYIQLEAFIFHFAALPWLFLTALHVLENKSRRSLLIFLLVSFISSTQGFIPPLFVAYMFALTLFLVTYLVSQRFSKDVLKKSMLIIIVTLIANLYWLIPLGYYTATRSNVYLNSYNNLMSTPEFISKNKKYGTLDNVALIKGFISEAVESSGPKGTNLVFQPWTEHQKNLGVRVVGYGLFILSIIGVVGTFLYKRTKISLALTGVFAFFFTGLTTNVFPFSIITWLMQNYAPIYKQAFRAAFTKFSIGIAFSYSLFLGVGIIMTAAILYSLFKKQKLQKLFFVLIFAGIAYYSLPYFRGNFFFKRLLVKIPPAYQNIFTYFRSQPDGRIADFPQDCPEGWFTYQWGYNGSGFYWYAIKQPILSRTFDVWSNNNENYYWEINQALREKNYSKIDSLFKKYDVRWVLYDPNIVHCRHQKALWPNEEFIKYLEQSPLYSLKKTFTSPGILPIKIFENSNTTDTNSFVKLVDDVKNIGPQYSWNDNDSAYYENGDYQTTTEEKYSTYYPFRSLFTKRQAGKTEFKVTTDNESIIFKTQLSPELQNSTLRLGSYKQTQKGIPVSIQIEPTDNMIYEARLKYLFPVITLDGSEIFNLQSTISLGQFNTEDLSGLQIFIDNIKLQSSGIENRFDGLLYFDLPNLIEIKDNDNQVLISKSIGDDPEYNALIEKKLAATLLGYSQGELEVKVPKLAISPGTKNFLSNFDNKLPRPCNEPSPSGRNKFEIGNEGSMEYVRMISQNSRQCLIFNTSELSTSESYLFTVSSRRVKGSNPALYISNSNQIHYLDLFIDQQNTVNEDFQTYNFIIPATFKDELGYDIYLDSYSQNNDVTINDFGGLEIWNIPYELLSTMKIEEANPISRFTINGDGKNSIDSVDHPNETSYYINLSMRPENPISTLVLSQSFDPGWTAYGYSDKTTLNFFERTLPFLFGKKLESHILVNNWENGWNLNPDSSNIQHPASKIAIIFMPQYFQYIGFGLLIITVCVLLIKHQRRHFER